MNIAFSGSNIIYILEEAMEVLEGSQVCRLCGKLTEMSVDIFGKCGNHAERINLLLPILVHEMDLLPKRMCHPCSYKLEEFNKFYEDCAAADADLKQQLSWMRTGEFPVDVISPMVRIKTEPPDYDALEKMTNDISSATELRNCAETRFADYRNSEELQLSAQRSVNCGCYCLHEKISAAGAIKRNSSARRKTANHWNGGKTTNFENASRETVRRNLFATQMFANKTARIQTEIPLSNVAGLLHEAKKYGDQISCKIEAVPRIEMATVPEETSTRTLRPRKSKTETQEKDPEIEAPLVRARTDVKDDSERTLRPRMEIINYTESRVKNPLARLTRRPRSSSRSEKNVNKKKIAEVSLSLSRTGEKIVIVKSDNDSPRSLRKSSSKSTEKRSRRLIEKKDHSPTGSSKYSSRNIVKNLSHSIVKYNEQIAESSRNKSNNINKISQKLLRSSNLDPRARRLHLRNDKLKEKDWIALDDESCSPIRRENRSSRISATPIRLQRIGRINDKSLATLNPKYHLCVTCPERFASPELYKLHGCFANRRK